MDAMPQKLQVSSVSGDGIYGQFEGLYTFTTDLHNRCAVWRKGGEMGGLIYSTHDGHWAITGNVCQMEARGSIITTRIA